MPRPERNEALSDETLAAAASTGDRGALEVLLDRHVDRVVTVCRRVTGHPEDALDAAQEALIAVARRIGSYDGRARFTTWLYRVATNAALDEVRRRRRRPEPFDDPPAVSEQSFEAGVDARLDVDAALSGLSPDFRAAVALRDLCDLDYADIAAILDVPIGTVRSRIARGRAALADHLGNQTDPPARPNQRTP